MKQCTKCGEVKPLTEFHKNSQLRDGHVNLCKPCACAKAKAWVAENTERHAANCKRYQTENKALCLANAQKWAEENRERSRQLKREWKQRNPDAVRRHARDRYHRDPVKMAERKKAYLTVNRHVARAYLKKRRASNPLQRVTDAMGNRMRDAIRGRKCGEAWRRIVGYTVDELKSHLQSQFTVGMTWDNYGEWHIDHARPVASFDFSSDPLAVARICWALGNLQPLWALDNMKKGAKYDHG